MGSPRRRAERALTIERLPAPTLEPDLGHASGGSKSYYTVTCTSLSVLRDTPAQDVFVVQDMRIVIIANGEPPTTHDVARWLREDCVLICADGGASVALALDLHPHHVVGDFDSLSDGELHVLAANGAQLHRHSPRKDETDLELALLVAAGMFTTEGTENTETKRNLSFVFVPSVISVVQEVKEIMVLGALGGRTDHMLANMLLLAMPALKGIHVIIAHGNERLFLIDARDAATSANIYAQPGDRVSLIPFGDDALGVSTDGLEYPLRDESLFIGPARGISNVMLGGKATVQLQQGMLLCVVATN